jgi:small conductance mechanosensitive channel
MMIEQEIAQLGSVYSTITDFLVRYSFQIVGAIIILCLGLWVSGRLGRWLFTTLEHKGIDVTLANFLGNLLKLVLVAVTFIIVLGKVGISITPFVAALGAVSLGAGLAIQGTLSNYGAGLAIILTRPFVMSNTLSVRGYTGIVAEINLATTILMNEDGERITIPNRHIVGEILKNTEANSLVEGGIGISYASDPKQAIEVITQALSAQRLVKQEPAMKIGIELFADSSINISYRVWVATANYHSAKFEANLAVYQALKQAGISIPFPQREVRVLNEPGPEVS